MLVSYSRGIRGYGEARRNLSRLATEAPKEVARSAKREFEIEKKESQRRTPFLTGALRDSHRVSEPTIHGGIIRVTISAGDGLDYAIRVHEDLEMYHPHGQAKFLQSTLEESASFMAQRIASGTNIRMVIGS